MSDANTKTITDSDRVEWLLRYGSPIQIDGGSIQSREQVDEQIRKSRFRTGRAEEDVLAPSDAVAADEESEVGHHAVTPRRMHGLAEGTLRSRSTELSMITAANRQLAIVIGDLRLRRYS